MFWQWNNTQHWEINYNYLLQHKSILGIVKQNVVIDGCMHYISILYKVKEQERLQILFKYTFIDGYKISKEVNRVKTMPEKEGCDEWRWGRKGFKRKQAVTMLPVYFL